MKNDCSVVKDLIPLYEEGLVSEETKEFIDEHCQSCENCKNLLENLAKSYHEQETNDNKKEKIWGEIAIKERKRKKKRYLTLSLTSVILVTLVVLGFIFLPKPLQKIYYENQTTQYDFNFTEQTLAKTGFTENDILAASEAVKNFFEEHSDDRKLLRLAYDEKETTDENKTVYNPHHADAIVFIGEYYFFEDPVAGDGSRLRTNWKWFVKKDSNGEWKIIGQGYD